MEFHGAKHASAKSIVLIHTGLHAFGAGRRLSYFCGTPSRFDAAINQDIYLGCYARSQEFLPVHLRSKNKYLLGMLSRHQGLRPRFRRKNNMAAQKFENQSAVPSHATVQVNQHRHTGKNALAHLRHLVL